jgi:hypothetical protein
MNNLGTTLMNHPLRPFFNAALDLNSSNSYQKISDNSQATKGSQTARPAAETALNNSNYSAEIKGIKSQRPGNNMQSFITARKKKMEDEKKQQEYQASARSGWLFMNMWTSA